MLTNEEKEKIVLDVHQGLAEVGEFGHACKWCMACSGRFDDGEPYQDVFDRMWKEGKLGCQKPYWKK